MALLMVNGTVGAACCVLAAHLNQSKDRQSPHQGSAD
jgi:hypothetical protein